MWRDHSACILFQHNDHLYRIPSRSGKGLDFVRKSDGRSFGKNVTSLGWYNSWGRAYTNGHNNARVNKKINKIILLTNK